METIPDAAKVAKNMRWDWLWALEELMTIILRKEYSSEWLWMTSCYTHRAKSHSAFIKETSWVAVNIRRATAAQWARVGSGKPFSPNRNVFSFKILAHDISIKGKEHFANLPALARYDSTFPLCCGGRRRGLLLGLGQEVPRNGVLVWWCSTAGQRICLSEFHRTHAEPFKAGVLVFQT